MQIKLVKVDLEDLEGSEKKLNEALRDVEMLNMNWETVSYNRDNQKIKPGFLVAITYKDSDRRPGFGR